MKKATIVGANGQDGRFLYDLLSKKGYQLFGIVKNFRANTNSEWIKPIDISNVQNVFDCIREIQPDEIYYLGAVHNSSEDVLNKNIDLFKKSYNVHVSSLINFLEGIKEFSKKTKLFYAASSHIFGDAEKEPQDENTPVNPKNIYGITKAAGLFACRFYRDNYSMFVSAGILYNHESPLRKQGFVSRKIIRGAINIKNKKQDKLFLGDLTKEVDWGYAADYVDAFYRILQIEKPGDFIIATGMKHSVKEFVEIVFDYLELNWRDYVKEDRNIVKKKGISLVGNPGELKSKTGWHPTVDFKQMIKLLLIEEGIRIANE